MGWLAAIRTARFDAVVGTNRNVQFLLEIAIVVADQETESSVRILEPAFVGGGDALARVVARLRWQFPRCQSRATGCCKNEPNDSEARTHKRFSYCEMDLEE